MKIKTEADIIEVISNDEKMMHMLRIVRDVQLPDWYIGAGFVRNKIWDELHDYKIATPLNDVDVIYFDLTDISENAEKNIQEKLSAQMPNEKWSVTNEARMHIVNGDEPYRSSADAFSKWPETATCVAVRLEDKGSLALAASYGIDDLVHMRARPTPYTLERRPELFTQRMEEKKWHKIWPQVTIVNI